MSITYRLQHMINNVPVIRDIAQYRTNKNILRPDPYQQHYSSNLENKDLQNKDSVALKSKLVPVAIKKEHLNLVLRARKMENVGIHATIHIACKQALLSIVNENAIKTGKRNFIRDKTPVIKNKTNPANPISTTIPQIWHLKVM